MACGHSGAFADRALPYRAPFLGCGKCAPRSYLAAHALHTCGARIMARRSRAVAMRSGTAFRALPSELLVADAEPLALKSPGNQGGRARRFAWFCLGAIACFGLLASAGGRAEPSPPQEQGAAANVATPAAQRAMPTPEPRIVVEPVPMPSPAALSLAAVPSTQRPRVENARPAAAERPANKPRSAFDEPLAPPE